MVQQYKEVVRQNLLVLNKRLYTMMGIISQSEKFNDPSNFFVIKQDGTELLHHQKQELVTKMSPILMTTFIEILEGNYEVGSKIKQIKIQGDLIEYEFIAFDEQNEEG